MISLHEGARLVKLARKSIKSKFSLVKLRVDSKSKKDFGETLGCFVTLYKGSDLRGCIGYSDPVYPLYEGLTQASQAAAFNDPRFTPLEKNEFDDITVEISVLTKPARIDVRNPEDYMSQIQVGKDGILVKGTFSSGLLLPKVATEYKWDSLTFLRQTCIKAQLKPDDWQDFDKVRIYKFQTQVFGENKPNGEIIQLM